MGYPSSIYCVAYRIWLTYSYLGIYSPAKYTRLIWRFGFARSAFPQAVLQFGTMVLN